MLQFADGEVVGAQTSKLEIAKMGIEAELYDFALARPALYGAVGDPDRPGCRLGAPTSCSARPDAMSRAGARAGHGTACRVFLVVVDETEEMRNALRYACRRAQHTNGRVALLTSSSRSSSSTGSASAGSWRRTPAPRPSCACRPWRPRCSPRPGRCRSIHIREGQRAEQLVALLQEDPTISLLVLATAPGGVNPGTLVTFLLSHLGRRVPCP